MKFTKTENKRPKSTIWVSGCGRFKIVRKYEWHNPHPRTGGGRYLTDISVWFRSGDYYGVLIGASKDSLLRIHNRDHLTEQMENMIGRQIKTVHDAKELAEEYARRLARIRVGGN